ncbi:MAG: nitrogenase iron-molybdenum cofactor biosynthesis protein NifN [Thermodesulfobacteriota bacterium]
MGKVEKNNAALQINPVKLSQPMGATLAFLGVDRCMPLLHGGQGCASFTKVYFTRHFNEPIALQTTAVTDVVAVLDGGDYSIVEAVKNVSSKVYSEKGGPALIGLYTSGMPETKGDDIQRVAKQVDSPLVYVNTPDYSGGLESGWALTCTALINQICRATTSINTHKAVLLPHVSMQPLEVERIKEFISLFGYEVLALPDLSTSLDGHLGEKQAALSSGGIEVAQIESLADASLVLSVGESMRPCAEALQGENPHMRWHHSPHLGGLIATDELTQVLLRESGTKTPPASVRRWRKRLQDAMLDTHFSLGQTGFAVVAEPDQLASICATLYEAGGRVQYAVSPTDSAVLEHVRSEHVIVGDLGSLGGKEEDYSVLVGNFHCERMAHQLGKGYVTRGFPNWEEVGNQLKDDLLYAGSAFFLCECANAATLTREQQDSHFEMKTSA